MVELERRRQGARWWAKAAERAVAVRRESACGSRGVGERTAEGVRVGGRPVGGGGERRRGGGGTGSEGWSGVFRLASLVGELPRWPW